MVLPLHWFYIDMNQPWVYMCPPPEPPSPLPPHPIPQGHPSAPALSTLPHASNLDWWSISHMIIYMYFNAILSNHPPTALSHRVQKTVLYIRVSFAVLHSKVMLKIIQARLQQYMNHELPDVQVGLEKAEEQEIKLPTSTGSSKKQESSRKTSISSWLTMPKPLTVWIT